MFRSEMRSDRCRGTHTKKMILSINYHIVVWMAALIQCIRRIGIACAGVHSSSFVSYSLGMAKPTLARRTKSVERQIKNAESPRSNIAIRKKAAKLTFTDRDICDEHERRCSEHHSHNYCECSGHIRRTKTPVNSSGSRTSTSLDQLLWLIRANIHTMQPTEKSTLTYERTLCNISSESNKKHRHKYLRFKCISESATTFIIVPSQAYVFVVFVAFTSPFPGAWNRW